MKVPSNPARHTGHALLPRPAQLAAHAGQKRWRHARARPARVNTAMPPAAASERREKQTGQSACSIAAACKGLAGGGAMAAAAAAAATGMATGTAMGACVVQQYYVLEDIHRATINRSYRILLLFPHTSAQARARAAQAMDTAMRRTAVFSAQKASGFAASKIVRQMWNMGRGFFRR